MSIKQIKELRASDAPVAGGKGASLGEMTQAGINVPPGFVILTDAFNQFLQKTDIGVEIDAILGTINTEVTHTIDQASEKIQGLILAEAMPQDVKDLILEYFDHLDAEFVAVRSSATAEDGANAA